MCVARPGERLNLDFTDVVFDGGDFHGARFFGSIVRFNGASFPSGAVNFRDARFLGSQVYFGGAKFCGGVVNFHGAQFSGGVVSFSGPAEWSYPPQFGWDKPPAGVILPARATQVQAKLLDDQW